jgi:hypothetical protein
MDVLARAGRGALLIAAAIAVCVGARVQGQSAVATLAVEGRANAHVSLAAEGGFVVAAWAASLPSGVTDIYAAVSWDGGATFGSPTRVNSTPGDARVNGEQPPRLALTSRATGDPAVTVLWTSKGVSGTTLLTARSNDGGRSFSSSTLVPGTDAPGNRGWQAIAADRSGALHAAWLDHRELAAQDTAKPVGGTHAHAGHATSIPGTPGTTASTGAAASADKTDGVAMAAYSQLYVGVLGGAQDLPRPITGSVCYCCKTALATGVSGTVFAAWRHVYPGNMRDIAFSMSGDGGRTYSRPVRVSEDQWQLNGCPDDGPAMVVDGRGRVHMVWPTVVIEKGEPVKALFHALSPDGKGFGTRTRVPTQGFGHHPQLALAGDGSIAVVWDEVVGAVRRIGFARGIVDRSGRIEMARLRVAGGEAPETGADVDGVGQVGVYPVVAPVGDHVLVAWTDNTASWSIIRVVRRRIS